MKQFKRTTMLLGVLAALAAGTTLTSAYADSSGEGTKGCCEKCEGASAAAKVAPAPGATTKTPDPAPAGKVDVSK